MGGLLVKKLNLSALGAIRMAMLVNLISTACYVSFLFLGCDTGLVAGVTVPYNNRWEQDQRDTLIDHPLRAEARLKTLTTFFQKVFRDENIYRIIYFAASLADRN